MTVTTWSYTEGDPRALRWTFSLVEDAGDDSSVSADVRESWGSFELHVAGENLCATVQQGESVHAAHWYLLPLAEWLVEQWNPLFHEQRLPLARSASAASAAARALTYLDSESPRSRGSWGYVAQTDDDLVEQYQQWSSRHRLATASPEAPMPDVWLRRVDVDLEISTTDPDRALFADDVHWMHGSRVSRVPVAAAAEVTERALRALLDQLVRRRPGGRAAAALRRFNDATGPRAEDERLAWLVGLHGDTGQLAALRSEIDAVAEVAPEAATDGSPVLLAPPVSTLFGSLSPAVQRADLDALVAALGGAEPAEGLHDSLDRLADLAPEDSVRGLAPGEAGGELGDAVAQEMPWGGDQVGVAAWLQRHGVHVTSVRLSDPTLRAVTLLHEDGRAVVAVNEAYERGTAPHVARFTLAHELAHLVYDRHQARTLAVASGPWTPLRVEQRANGFAAGLLMPEGLLRKVLAGEPEWPEDASALGRVATRLGVGVTALTERLPNSGLMSTDAAERMREQYTG